MALEFEQELAADDIDVFRLFANDLGRGKVTLSWRGPGEGFSAERQVEASAGKKIRAGLKSYRLTVHGHPAWRGRIAGLRFNLEPQRGKTVAVKKVQAIAVALAEQRVSEALERSWKVDVSNDVRDVLLSFPGHPVVRVVEVPDRAELRFAYALQTRSSVEVWFRVKAVTEREKTIQLFEDQFDEELDTVAWREASVDLEPVAGERVRLVLEVETSAGQEAAAHRSLPVFAHPEIMRPATRAIGKNVLLVVVDTLRADHLSLYGYPRNTSPQLDSWAVQNAAVFDTAVAPSPWTLPSHVSLFSGLDALSHGVNGGAPAPQDLQMLAEVLHERGYATVALTGGGFVHPKWGFAQGFDSYRYFGDIMGFEDELSTNLDSALEIIDRNADRPTFLFFHTYEVHNPYRARQPYFGEFSNLDPKGYHIRVDHPPSEAEDGFLGRRCLTLLHKGKAKSECEIPPDLRSLPVDLYDSSIAYMDAILARLLAALSKPGWSDRTVVVLTSDHGEMFGEHGLVNHISLYDENLLVPLVIADPSGLGVGQRFTSQVRLVDVAPTVLELVGAEAQRGLDGVSLVPLMARERSEVPREAWSYASASNYGVSLRLANEYKYIFRNSVWPSIVQAEELYDLELDPAEKTSLIGSSDRAESFRGLVANILQEKATGAHFRFSNSGSTTILGEFRSPVLKTTSVKTSRPVTPRFRWESKGHATFRVSPGDRFTVWFEGIVSGKLEIQLSEKSGANPFETIINLGDLSVTPRNIELVASTFRNRSGPLPEGSTGVNIWMQGSTDRISAPIEVDERLKDQLEALGYVQ
jgi:arylsulfatase A-like enzyme